MANIKNSTAVSRAIITMARKPEVYSTPYRNLGSGDHGTLSKRDISGGLLAACVLVLADHSTLAERVERVVDGDNGVGFSGRTIEDGMTIANWVRGRVYGGGRVRSPKRLSWEHGPKGSDKSWAHVAFDVVNHHRKQLGRLEVENGALTKALKEVEAKLGLPGLAGAFRGVVWEEKYKAKPVKVRGFKPIVLKNAGDVVAFLNGAA